MAPYSRARARRSPRRRPTSAKRRCSTVRSSRWHRSPPPARPGRPISAILQTMVQTLANQPTIGRISVTIDPAVLLAHPDRDPLLETGDAIYIPKRPSTVAVTGEVLNAGAFAYQPESDGGRLHRSGRRRDRRRRRQPDLRHHAGRDSGGDRIRAGGRSAAPRISRRARRSSCRATRSRSTGRRSLRSTPTSSARSRSRRRHSRWSAATIEIHPALREAGHQRGCLIFAASLISSSIWAANLSRLKSSASARLPVCID